MLPNLPLLPPLLPGGNPVLLIDNSTLDLYNLCPREGEYGHMRNFVSASDKVALNFGAGAHEGFKWRYTVCDTSPVDSAAQLAQNEVITKHFNDHPQPMDEFRCPSLCHELMARYNERYQQEPFTIETNPRTKKKCVEQSVMLFLGTLYQRPYNASGLSLAEPVAIDLYYTGRIDLIIRDSSGLWVLDHKTTFQFGQQFSDSMSMSAQFLGYAWAWQTLTGELPAGYIINAIRVRRPTQKSLLAEDFFRSSGADTDFIRLPYYITQDLIDEWKENTLALVSTILYHHSSGTFPMNRTQCVRKWGSCQFFEVCNCNRGQRLDILQSQAFMQNEWSPLNKVEAQTKQKNQ